MCPKISDVKKINTLLFVASLVPLIANAGEYNNGTLPSY
jgi:hypothetical protein